VVTTLSGVAERLRGQLLVTHQTPLRIRAQISDLRMEAAAEADPPHRLTGLRVYPSGGSVTDDRVAAPTTHTFGDVPQAAIEVAQESFTELGLVGLAMAGASGHHATPNRAPVWMVVHGWADLERAEVLRPSHRFLAYSITKLITATAVLRLVADQTIGLDDPANEHLRTVRLADDAVTVGELLTHTAGVDDPDLLFADSVPDPASLLGPVMPCGRPHGTFTYSNGGYGMLGQLIADVTGLPYTHAATRLVLEPLAMTDSFFPTTWPGTDAIRGYRLTDTGSFTPHTAQLCTLPAAGGLWATASDLARFGAGWASLLPKRLARQALQPQALRDTSGGHIGLGWLLSPSKDLAGHAGGGPGASTSLLTNLTTGHTTIALTNRQVHIEAVNARLTRPIA